MPAILVDVRMISTQAAPLVHPLPQHPIVEFSTTFYALPPFTWEVRCETQE